jgi:tRNA U34 5-carboxymethylaminomethyl modifying GTPase MnmE/TrmE
MVNSTLVEIVDTAGAAGYQDLRQRWIEESDIILVVVDDSLPNLDEADRILKSLQSLHPAILVRNQFDVKPKDDSSSNDLARKHGCGYFGLSAMDREQVRKLFTEAVRLTNLKACGQSSTRIQRQARIRIQTTCTSRPPSR